MKKILFVLVVLGALIYFGVIRISNDKANTQVKQGINKGVQFTKRGINTVAKGIQEASNTTSVTK